MQLSSTRVVINKVGNSSVHERMEESTHDTSPNNGEAVINKNEPTITGTMIKFHKEEIESSITGKEDPTQLINDLKFTIQKDVATRRRLEKFLCSRFFVRGGKKKTPIQLAIINSSFPWVNFIVRLWKNSVLPAKAQLNSQNSRQMTILHYSVSFCILFICNSLINLYFHSVEAHSQ